MLLTIFTPTYNRAHTLTRLYESLTRQSDFDFEWIVVDDGSTDNTESLIAGFAEKNNKFPIIYYKQPNGGKHRAINRGVKMAHGEWFFIVDSDDYLTDDAIAVIKPYLKEVTPLADFAGVVFNRIYHNGETVGAKCNYDVLDSDFLTAWMKLKIIGDKAEIIKSKVFEEFPFPEFDGEKFTTEAVVWSRMAQKYKVRYVNKGIYVCEYLPGGLTDTYAQIMDKSPKASMLYYKELASYSGVPIKNRLFAEAGYWHHYTATEVPELEPTPAMRLRRPLIIFLKMINRLRKTLLYRS